jgi:hypothetical protein
VPEETKKPEPVVVEVEKPKTSEILDEKTKQFYIKENIEIDQLITQVMSGQQPQASGDKLSKQSTEQLLKFLIHIVMHKEELPQGMVSTNEHRKQNLL